MEKKLRDIIDLYRQKYNQLPSPEWLFSKKYAKTLEQAQEAIEYMAHTPQVHTPGIQAQPVKKAHKFDFHNLPIPVIRIMAAVISVFSAIRSGGYVYGYFNAMDNSFNAGIMALMVVAVSLVFPQVVIQLLREPIKRKIFIGVVGLASITFLGFSIFTSINGLYSARSSSIELQSASRGELVLSSSRLDDIKSLLSDLDIQSKGFQGQIQLIQKNLGEYAPGSVEYNRTKSNLNGANDELAKIQVRKSELMAERAKILSNPEVQKTVRQDSISWLSKSFGVDIELWITITFAVALDLVGPASLAICLFL